LQLAALPDEAVIPDDVSYPFMLMPSS
jgi:hypothetical protein